MSIAIQLTDEELEAIQAQETEGGGFQGLFGYLQAGIVGHELTVTEQIARRAIRYRGNYGTGGWEDVLDSIATKLEVALEQ